MGVAATVTGDDVAGVGGDRGEAAVQWRTAGRAGPLEIPDDHDAIPFTSRDGPMASQTGDGLHALGVRLHHGHSTLADVPDVRPSDRIDRQGMAALVVDGDVEDPSFHLRLATRCRMSGEIGGKDLATRRVPCGEEPAASDDDDVQVRCGCGA